MSPSEPSGAAARTRRETRYCRSGVLAAVGIDSGTILDLIHGDIKDVGDGDVKVDGEVK